MVCNVALWTFNNDNTNKRLNEILLWEVQNVIYQVHNNDNNNNLNEKLQLKYKALIGDLDGIQPKDMEWSLERYKVNNNNTFNTELY